MKKLYILLASAFVMLLPFSSQAQEPMNGNFENWYYYEFCLCDLLEGKFTDGADSSHQWVYPNDYGVERPAASKSSRGEAQDGNYSVHIQNYDYGIAPLKYQFPYEDLTEDVFSGYYKSNILSGDSAEIKVYYQKGTDNTLATASYYIANTANDWTKFNLTLNKDNGADSIIVEFWPSTTDTLSEIWIDNVAFTSTVDLEEGLNESQLTVYPNPASDVVNLQIGNATAQQRVILTDLTGKTVVDKMVNGETNVQLQVGNLQSGLYILQLRQGESLTTKRLILD